MNARTILALGCILFGCAVYALHTDQMRVTAECRDSRLYMDGGIDANIESGGLNFHRTITVYRRHNQKHLLVGSSDIFTERSEPGKADYFQSSTLTLKILKDKPVTTHGTPAQLDAVFGPEKVSVSLNCLKK